MPLVNDYDLSNLKNHTEEMVFRVMEEQLGKLSEEEVCKCQDCVLDMVCLSLNNLKPKYRVSLMGNIYSTATDDDFDKKVETAVEEAVAKISINPAHG